MPALCSGTVVSTSHRCHRPFVIRHSRIRADYPRTTIRVFAPTVPAPCRWAVAAMLRGLHHPPPPGTRGANRGAARGKAGHGRAPRATPAEGTAPPHPRLHVTTRTPQPRAQVGVVTHGDACVAPSKAAPARAEGEPRRRAPGIPKAQKVRAPAREGKCAVGRASRHSCAEPATVVR